MCDEIIISSMKVTQLIVSLPLSTVLPPDLVFCQMSQPYSRVHGGIVIKQYNPMNLYLYKIRLKIFNLSYIWWSNAAFEHFGLIAQLNPFVAQAYGFHIKRRSLCTKEYARKQAKCLRSCKQFLDFSSRTQYTSTAL